jgi:hypothetical protein
MALRMDPTEKPARKPASLLQVASAVFWSFFGVRKGRHMLQDMESIKPQQVIIVGLLSALAIVLALIALVRVILRNAAG